MRHTGIQLLGLLLALLLPLFIHADTVPRGRWQSGSGDTFAGIRLRGARLTGDQDNTRGITLPENTYSRDAMTDYLLHCDSGRELREAGQYFPYRYVEQTVRYSDKSRFGGRALRFLYPEDRIVLDPGADSLFGETLDMGSFTIEMWLYPYSLHDNAVILSREGPFAANGNIQTAGIRGLFEGERLVWDFENIFRTPDGEYRRIRLTSGPLLEKKKWQHIAIRYDHTSGRLSKLINGREEEVYWATDTRAHGGTPLIAAFPENLRRHLVLGKSYRGKMDEIRFSRNARASFRIRPYAGVKGIAVSRVYDSGHAGSRLQKIAWRANTPAGTAVRLEYRVADYIFPPDYKHLAWHPVRNGETNFPDRAASGRYIQWRARLLGAARGRYAPVLRDVRFDYSGSRAPLQPSGLQVRAGDRKIRVSWDANVDNVDGYYIYIGTQPGEYLLPGSPIYVPLDSLDTQSPEYVIYGLENDRLYYIALSAYDGKAASQSSFTREVHARPGRLMAAGE